MKLAERDPRIEASRQELLELLEQTRRGTVALLGSLDPGRVVNTDSRAWRVRDVVGHLGVWNGEAARSIRAFALGAEYTCVGSRDGYDRYNGPAADLRSAWPLAQVWAEYEDTHVQLKDAVEAVPAARWNYRMVFPWNEQGTVEQLIRRMMKHEKTDHCDLIAGATS